MHVCRLRDSSQVPTEYITVTIDTIYFLSNTSELIDVTSIWETEECTTQYQEDGSDNTYPADCKFGSSSSDAVCRNAVASIAYTISHHNDGASTIGNVSASIVVTDVLYHEDAMLSQSFAVEFVNSGVAAGVSKDNGNIVKRYKISRFWCT